MTSYFYPAQKILNSREFISKLKELELETIPHSRFKSVEKIIESPQFDIGKIKLLSPCLHHLLSWVLGKFFIILIQVSLSSIGWLESTPYHHMTWKFYLKKKFTSVLKWITFWFFISNSWDMPILTVNSMRKQLNKLWLRWILVLIKINIF